MYKQLVVAPEMTCEKTGLPDQRPADQFMNKELKMTTRENLLALVSSMLRGYFGVTTALEHDAGDYERADAMSSKATGKPIALWTFQGDEAHNEPYTGQSASGLYFHIDETNNRAVLVNPPLGLSGAGYVINGHDGTYQPRWRS